MLPFGLRSAPKIFTAVADALEWCVRQQGVVGIDIYLDDLIVAPPALQQCKSFLAILEDKCQALGFKLASEKKQGPTTCLPFLGIIINTATGRLYLPDEKLAQLQRDIDHWLQSKACRRRVGDVSWSPWWAPCSMQLRSPTQADHSSGGSLTY